MKSIEERFYADRALRDAAKAVLLADIDHARTSFSAKGVADRVGTRIGEGAADVLDTAKDVANDNRGIIAALIGAILLWLGREPLFEALGFGDEAEADADADEPVSENTSPGDNHEP